MELSTHLTFDGRCEEAFKLYEQVLRGKITFAMKFKDAPMPQSNPEWGEKIVHTTLTFGDQSLAGADAPPDHYKKPQGFSVVISLKDAAEAERIFNALAEGAKVNMPLQETFWALRYASLTDRYGTPWEINCEKPR